MLSSVYFLYQFILFILITYKVRFLSKVSYLYFCYFNVNYKFRYTHVLVNLPMLLGPLAPVFLVTILNWILDACYLPWKKKPSLRNVYALSLFTTVVPLIALSAVKHQGLILYCISIV